ncbi:MAG: DedA family protein, partial [Chitinophagaceae bacterium]
MILLDVFHWSQLLQPQFYIEHGGLWLLLFVVFAETGLFFGFFLPGDSLLFVAGIYSMPLASQIYVTENEWLNLFILFSFISVAGIIGNYVGYKIGKNVGLAMYDWKDNMLFKQK